MNLQTYRQTHGPKAWQELAEKAGTSYNYIVQIANGHRKAGPKMLAKLIEASDGQLTREALRPDFFGPASSAA